MTFNSIRGQLGDIFILKSYSFIYGSNGKESLIVMGNEHAGKTCLNVVSQNLIKKPRKTTRNIN